MKIGLALGSGASRGWAHIGVIQALEELGIEIDIVTGCSIGSYVGAAYASGKLEPLAEWVKSLTEWQVFALMGVGFYRGGLVSGLKVFKALEDNFAFDTFDKLHKPFAAVATDLYSGREVDFTQGSVIQAVRASCAIPGLFPPVCIDNRWLVDGGVVTLEMASFTQNTGKQFGAMGVVNAAKVNLTSVTFAKNEAVLSAQCDDDTNYIYDDHDDYFCNGFESGAILVGSG
ncbi:MAG: patatin-like phospholipase family protein, partial [Paraglaciecola sp.]|nr:patatin-like phospholipase family protein [Paraglaciecola sp.]